MLGWSCTETQQKGGPTLDRLRGFRCSWRRSEERPYAILAQYPAQGLTFPLPPLLSSADPKLMGPDVLQRWRNGETLPTTLARTPLVELPLGATEDRICGTIDIEKALTEGVKVRGFLAFFAVAAAARRSRAAGWQPWPLG